MMIIEHRQHDYGNARYELINSQIRMIIE